MQVIHPMIVQPVEEWANTYLLPLYPGYREGMRIVFPRNAQAPRPTEQIMLAVLTRDEIRQMYGYPALTPEQAAELDARGKTAPAPAAKQQQQEDETED